MFILVAEDELRMAALLKRGVEAEGHQAVVVHTGPDGLEAALSGHFDAIILDVLLPRLDGFEVARQLRKRGNRTPVLMLTARDAPGDKIHGLDNGADDYLTKPFLFAELLARLRAIVRRGQIARPPSLQVDDLVLDPATREVTRNGHAISLTRTEFSLLELLMRHPGAVIPRERILESIWPTADSVEEGTLNAFVSLLRRKIDRGQKHVLLKTIRGAGYCITGERR